MIENFNGKTFVAFLDISGFKKLMNEDGDEALSALNKFYQSGYDTLMSENIINGLFVSDCGVLFVKENGATTNGLNSLLNVIKKINQDMLHSGFMLTTSIAYGKFIYENRIKFEGIDKQSICGGAYLNAFIDNENGTPKIQPGQCRIITKDIPPEIDLSMNNDNLFKCVKSRDGDDGHLYYYWNVTHQNKIITFEDAYKKSENARYTIINNALNGKKTTLEASDF